MKISPKYWIVFSAILTIGGLWFWQSVQANPHEPQQLSSLSTDINTCDDITEKAAANLVAVVDFQKLEIAGRKARVFRLCMSDRGYIENPLWTRYAEPVAKKTAQSGNISADEAIENMRRASMMMLTANTSEPMFWIKK